MPLHPPHGPDSELDPDAPPTEQELAAAESLRAALEGRATGDRDADLARALKIALDPRPIDARVHAAILDRVVAPRSRLRRALWFAGPAVAIAAGAILYVSLAPTPTSKSPTRDALIAERSTSALFHEPFPRSGATSSRVDRIAMVRSRDLRDNEFTRWGVR